MKKTTKFAKKRRTRPQGATFNGGEWLSTIMRCRSYSSDPISGSYLPDGGATDNTARSCELRVISAFDSLKKAQVAPDDCWPYDLLAEALGIAWIRAIEIAGETENPMLQILEPGIQALRRVAVRRKEKGAWGLDGPAIGQIESAIDVYSEILHKSSPAQMVAALDKRVRLLKFKNLTNQ